MITTHRHLQKGFTIIELMIATAVLSTILVMVTVVMVNIGSLYYKGINQARVQDDVRSIADEIIKNIQLNDQPPTDTSCCSRTALHWSVSVRSATPMYWVSRLATRRRVQGRYTTRSCGVTITRRLAVPG